MFLLSDGAPQTFQPLHRPIERVEWSQGGLDSSHLGYPSVPRLAPLVSSLPALFYSSEKAEKTLERSINPVRSQGLEKVLHPSFHQYPKWRVSGETAPKRLWWCPIPPSWVFCTPPLYTALEEQGLLGGEGFPLSALTHMLLAQLPGPHSWHPLLLFPPTP